LKETVGASSLRLSGMAPQASAIEQMRENLTDYDINIHKCIKKHRSIFQSDFYVVVITKKEKIMKNVLRGYFTARLSCPTPDYDQAVYKYIRKGDQLDFLWVIPARDVSIYMSENITRVPPSKYALLDYVLKFKSGELYKQAIKLNAKL